MQVSLHIVMNFNLIIFLFYRKDVIIYEDNSIEGGLLMMKQLFLLKVRLHIHLH